MSTPTIPERLAALKEQQKERLQRVAQSDPQWCYLKGRIDELEALVAGDEGGDDPAP